MGHPESVELEPKDTTKSKPKNNKVEYKGKLISVDDLPDESDDSINPSNPFMEAMNDAIDPYVNLPRNTIVPEESKIKFPANYWEMCKMHGENVKIPFPRALWMGWMLFGECCPNCNHPKAISNIFNIPVDVDVEKLARSITLFKHGVCPKCNAKKSDLVNSGKMQPFNELVLVAGQRASKSATTVSLMAHHIGLLLKAPKLATLMGGLQSYAPLTGSLVGLSATKAFKLLYVPLRDLMAESEFFKSYFEVLENHRKKTGQELYRFRPTGTYMRIFHKNLEVLPEAPNKRTLRGATRFFYGIDELGHFPLGDTKSSEDGEYEEDERERANAQETYTSLDNSLLTIRREARALYAKGIDSIPSGIGYCISSPASWEDKIMNMLQECADGKKPFTLAAKLPTWEMSPLYTRNDPEIAAMYLSNPIVAERDFGTNPPRQAYSAFTSGDAEAIFRKYPNHFKVETVYADNGRIYGKAIETFWPAQYRPSILTLDGGLVNNSFSFSVGHLDAITDNVIITAAGEVMLPDGGKVEVDYPLMYHKVLKPLIEACNVKFVAADRWNSAYILHQIEADFPGVKTKAHKMQPADVKLFMSVVAGLKLELPSVENRTPDFNMESLTEIKNYRVLENQPIRHLALQFLTVQHDKNNGGLDKGHNYTDDTFRCVLLATVQLYSKQVSDHLAKFPSKRRDAKSSQRGVVLRASKAMVL